MKKQNGFISSSSSVSISYSTSYQYGNWNTAGWKDLVIKNIKHSSSISSTAITKVGINENTSHAGTSWKTFYSSSYHRIEYFLEAVEKMNSPFESKSLRYTPLTNYSKSVARKNLYNGFVDVVLTFPFEVRLAGIEMFNPWMNKLINDEESGYWRYLPSKFSIFKVDNTMVNEALEKVTYENDIAKISSATKISKFRPIRYDKMNNDENLIFLGNYEVNWENTPSYKCFFKYNRFDPASIDLKSFSNTTGTATWKFKQLVLRIYETKMSLNLTNDIIDENLNITYIKEKVAEYILANELKYGTKFNGRDPTAKDCLSLIGAKNLPPKSIAFGAEKYPGWDFGGKAIRSYEKASDVKFESGINYKLGGIQLLLSPDIFSVSEMKMYNYANRSNNKVYIGEWNKETKNIQYYGSGTIKRSPNINISSPGISSIKWNHNFNIPPKYLEAEIYAKFNIDYESFCVGDIVKNLVNINKEPLTIKLTGTDVQVNISNGVCFTNPETGEFMTFLNGIGVQMDRPGNFDALKAAIDVGANIVDSGSSVSTIISGGYPFDLCFVVKRLF